MSRLEKISETRVIATSYRDIRNQFIRNKPKNVQSVLSNEIKNPSLNEEVIIKNAFMPNG